MEKCLEITTRLNNEGPAEKLRPYDKARKKELMRKMFSYQELESIVIRYEDQFYIDENLTHSELIQIIIERLKLGAVELRKFYTPEMEDRRRKRLALMSQP